MKVGDLIQDAANQTGIVIDVTGGFFKRNVEILFGCGKIKTIEEPRKWKVVGTLSMIGAAFLACLCVYSVGTWLSKESLYQEQISELKGQNQSLQNVPNSYATVPVQPSDSEHAEENELLVSDNLLVAPNIPFACNYFSHDRYGSYTSAFLCYVGESDQYIKVTIPRRSDFFPSDMYNDSVIRFSTVGEEVWYEVLYRAHPQFPLEKLRGKVNGSEVLSESG